MGTVSCSGLSGVSNSMASALWVLDALFSMDRSGVSGVNLHAVNGINALFVPRHSHGRWQATVDPWYYGALMFTQAAPAGARLLPVSNATDSDTRVWATLGRDQCRPRARDQRQHRLRCERARPVTLLVTAGERAPSSGCVHPAARTRPLGVTLGGRSFGGDPDRSAGGADQAAGAPPGRRLRRHAAARKRGAADLDEGWCSGG